MLETTLDNIKDLIYLFKFIVMLFLFCLNSQLQCFKTFDDNSSHV